MVRFEIPVPDADNDGVPFGPETLAAIKSRIADITGALTVFPGGHGVWRDPTDGREYAEPVSVYMTLTEESCREPLEALCRQIAFALRQECVALLWIGPDGPGISFHYADARETDLLLA